MKFRFTVGNIVGAITGIVGVLTQQEIISGLPTNIGEILTAIGTVVLLFSKNAVSSNTKHIPASEKIVDNAVLTVQKTLVK